MGKLSDPARLEKSSLFGRIFSKDRASEPEAQTSPAPAREAFAIGADTIFRALLEDEAMASMTPQEKRGLFGRVEDRLTSLGWEVITAGGMNPAYPNSREPLRQLSEIMSDGSDGSVVAYAKDLVWRIKAVHEYAELRELRFDNRQAFAPYPIPAKDKTQAQTEKLLALAAKHRRLRVVFAQLAWLMSQGDGEAEAFCEQLEAAYLAKVSQA